MSVNKDNIDMIMKGMRILKLGWDSLHLCELGNQTYKDCPTGRKPFKTYAERLGCIHVSLDWNGLDGALPVDLTKPKEEWAGLQQKSFDMVTNLGTSEHCLDQYMVFKNIHDLCQCGGLMIHYIPMIGSWKNHCPYRYSLKFMKMLSKENSYKILLNEERKRISPRKEVNLVVASILLKTNTLPFQSSQTFGKGLEFDSNYKEKKK